MDRKLDVFFHPRSIAVVGASRRRGTIGGEVFHNLLEHGFPGAVYPVNPTSKVIQSVRAYATVEEIPDEVDLAVIAVRAADVPEAVDSCVAKGVRGLVVISAGFGETGPAGRAMEQRMVEKVRAAGIRLIGPNCLGVLGTDPPLDATFAPSWPPPGVVSFCSQSGALGLAVLDRARELGVGIREFVSMGNKADVSGNDLLEHWEDDPQTKVILFYLESFGNPHRFVEIARRVARKKPIVAVKSGRTEAGARAATSHTGALAGLDVAVDALLGQAGVLRTDTVEELFDLAVLLANQPVPHGNRVAILTNAGGPAIMAADACESRGLKVATLSDATTAGLRAFAAEAASLRNPIDLLAGASAEQFGRAVRLLLADENVDALMVMFVPPLVTEASAVAEAVCRAAEGAPKPVLACFMGAHGVPQAREILRAHHIPSYASPEPAAIALARSARYGRWLEEPEGTTSAPTGIDPERARAALRGRSAGWLHPDAAREVLAAYGIRVPASHFVTSAGQAAEAAAEIGFPVALKLVSETITHKTDFGGVALDLHSTEDVRAAFRRIEARLESLGRRGEMAGALVQEQVPRGVETFVGMTRDPAFGTLLGFGIGGTGVELWRDVVFRVHPITDRDAAQMLGQIRAAPLLDGFRGSPPADRAAIADTILRVGALAADLPEIAELDLNPLIALEPGQGVRAVDARIRLA